MAMVLRLMEENFPLSYVVFYDTGMEFGAIYKMIDQIKPQIENYGAKFIILKPKTSFLEQMLLSPVHKRSGEVQYGYDWCGNRCRWATTEKVKTINEFLFKIENPHQYIGIAADEPYRIKERENVSYPLFDWGMTEKDCLAYCYKQGFDWQEDSIRLYDVLDRVSCYCCSNKNLKELRSIYHFLPKYWEKLRAIQSRVDRPFRADATIFDLERRFKLEDAQMSLFDL